jgi:DhnA family fructose-bisphosphate aldolase class Ia
MFNSIIKEQFMTGRDLRLNKLFSKGENAVIVAIDHGMFDGPIPGMMDLQETVKKINPCVDGVLLSPGMLRHVHHAFNYKGAPIPIVRINWSTVYCFHWKYNDAATVVAARVEDAVAAGAEIVLISLTLQTGSEAQDAKNVEVYCKLANEAAKWGIPVVGEFFPPHSDDLTAEEMHKKVFASCRILSELGADLIKTFYTNDFKKVTQSVPVPVLGLGAAKKPTQREALQLAADEIQDGARGVVFGRNAIQVNDPFNFQAALCDVVKGRLTVDQAIGQYAIA